MATEKTVQPEGSAAALGQVPVALIDEGAGNPRKRFRDMDELTQSVASFGVLQPLLLRNSPTHPGRYDLVSGARRLRAAKKAKLTEVPAIVRELKDREVLEAQIAENRDRDNIHFLEEAEAYRRLHQDHEVPADQIAKTSGQSKAYVYGSLKLCDLCEDAKTACYDDCLDKSRALLIARLPQDQQRKALRYALDVSRRRYGEGEEKQEAAAEAES